MSSEGARRVGDVDFPFQNEARMKGLVGTPDSIRYVCLHFFPRKNNQGKDTVGRQLDSGSRRADTEKMFEAKTGYVEFCQYKDGVFTLLRQKGDPELRVRWEQIHPKRVSGPEGGHYGQ